MLGKINPQRIELRKGNLYNNKTRYLEILDVDVATKTAKISFEDKINVSKPSNVVSNIPAQELYQYIIDFNMKLIGVVAYQKRFLLKPKRLVTFFQPE